MLPHNYHSIINYITYLENCLQNPNEIDTTLLKKNIRDLKQMFRNAKGRDQLGFIETSTEGLAMLEQDDSIINCKVVIGANLFNLKSHLNYLQIRHEV